MRISAICVVALLLNLSSLVLPAAELRPILSTETNRVSSGTNSVDLRATTTHLLAPGDILELKVFQEDDLNVKTAVDDEGYITHPLLQRIKVEGKTVQQASTIIRDLLKEKYLVNPQVSLVLLEIAKARFSIMGKVNKPGIYEMPPTGKFTLDDAVAMAGGFDNLAKVKEIFVRRRSVDNNVENLKVTPKKNDKPFEIKPGDTIVVPERAF